LWAAGIIAWGVGQRAEADASLAESAALARELGDLHQIAAALIVQAINATSRGDADQADRLLGEALEQVSLWEDDWLYTTALDAQAHLALMRRDFERAFQIITAQERVARRASDWNSLASGLCTHGLCARLLGEDKLAGDLFRESIRVATRTTILNVAMALTGLAGAASRLGESERAARLFGGADSFREKLGQDINWPEWQDLKQQDLELVRTHIGVTKFERMYAEGRAMAPETVVALALS
jgi:tetratricopeptide (TPR) repeat protein